MSDRHVRTGSAALAGYRPGRALPGEVYADPALFEAEIRRIFFGAWLCIGHVSQVAAVGDYFQFEIAGEAVIVVRSAPNRVDALVNVCRHRGSRVCVEPSGHASRLVCRYHGWTYGLDGCLLAAAHMPAGFDAAAHGLRRLSVEVLHGLIFVSFADRPPAFAPFEQDLGEALAPYRLEDCRVACRRNYPITANWKLAVENYCECYHCAPSHPEYSLGHGRALPDAEFASLLERVMGKAAEIGLTRHTLRRSWLAAGELGTDRGFERYPLLRGHLTGSRDGQPVAPLLGELRGYDGGATDLHLGPTTFGLAYCDHLVLYRFTPRALQATDCEISWLVRGDATQDSDYRLDALTWLWDVTTIADKRIIEHNQAGVSSRFYEPGPLSQMEDFTRRFIEWYVAVMGAAG